MGRGITPDRTIEIPEDTPEVIAKAIDVAGHCQFCRFLTELTKPNEDEYAIEAKIGPEHVRVGSSVCPWYRVRFLIPIDFPYRSIETVPLEPALKWYQHQHGDYPGYAHSNIICPPRLVSSHFEELLHPYIRHAYRWITNAEANNLVRGDERYEFPHILAESDLELLAEGGFRVRDPLQAAQFGCAHLAGVARREGRRGFCRVTELWDGQSKTIWQSEIRKGAFGPEQEWGWCPWVYVGNPVVEAPHRPPVTFDDLAVDIRANILRAAKLAGERDHVHPFLLMAFLVPDTWQGTPYQIVWQITLLEGLTKKTFTPPEMGAFLPNEGYYLWPRVRQLLERMKSLKWGRCTDVSEKALVVRRSEEGENLEGLKITIVGVGAVGSVMAEVLSKLGPSEIVLIDNDKLEAGNLVRHAALANQVGLLKAQAMADLITPITSGRSVRPVSHDVRRLPEKERDALRHADLVIDATGDEGVHEFLGNGAGLGDNALAWCYITPGPQFGVLILRKPGCDLSCRDAEGILAEEHPRLWEELLKQEDQPGGIVWPEPGCYHPTFRAAYHRVRLMADTFVTTILDWLNRECPSNLITVVHQAKRDSGFGLETHIACQLEV